MTNDLVKRLRERHSHVMFPAGASTFSEAADRIEALEVENARMRSWIGWQFGEDVQQADPIAAWPEPSLGAESPFVAPEFSLRRPPANTENQA